MSSSQSRNSPSGKEFCCTYCQRKFRRLEHLQRHTRRHTNEKPFKCSCGEAFSRKDLVKRHERLVHGSPSGSPQPLTPALQQSIPENGDYDTAEERVASLGRSATNVERLLATTGQFGGQPLATPASFSEYTDRDISRVASHRGNSFMSPAHRTGLLVPRLSLGMQILPHFVYPEVTHVERDRVLEYLQNSDLLGINFPSTDALTRFLAGYFSGFYPHAPFTHIPTFNLCRCSPELLLSMLAVGAACRYETQSAVMLYRLAKTLLFERQSEPECPSPRSVTHGIPGHEMFRPEAFRTAHLDKVFCFTCLISFALWQENRNIREDSLQLRGLLVYSLRSCGLTEWEDTKSPYIWEDWVEVECERRAKSFAFCLLNLQDIIFDLPPAILGQEMKFYLPCSCPEWTAPDEATWAALRRVTQRGVDMFDEVLKLLVSRGQGSKLDGYIPSPVSNYVLLHGLTQSIMLSRKVCVGLAMEPPAEHTEAFRCALETWATKWQQTPESNLEPLDPNGPLPFTSSVLLSFAYVQNCLSVDHDISVEFSSWNPAHIASKVDEVPLHALGENQCLAAHHAAHILEILSRLGVQYVKNNHASVWSVVAALGGFKCAVFLEKWLRALALANPIQPLTENECSVVEWIETILADGLPDPRPYRGRMTSKYRVMADRVIQIWSQIMHGNSPWPFINMLGDALDHYRENYGQDGDF